MAARQTYVAFTGRLLVERCDATQAARARTEGDYVTTTDQWAADLAAHGTYLVTAGRRTHRVTQAAALWAIQTGGLHVQRAA
jgi:hypothetical protein